MISRLTYILYRLAIFVYGLLIRIASPFNPKAKLFIEGRIHLFQIISGKIKNDPGPRVWFHCASLGEFEQARPIIEALRLKTPGQKIILTFFSPSGYEIRKNYSGADYIFYLPLDTPANARKLVELFNPTMVFFVKYEFWYHFINELRKRNIPIYLISAHFRKNQVFFRWYGIFFRKLLKAFTLIFIQNSESEKLLHEIGIRQTVLSGDTRFDRVYRHSTEAKPLPLIAKFKGDQKLLVAGSSYEQEENMVRAYLEKAGIQLKIILAPHEVMQAHIESIVQLFAGKNVVVYSQANEQNIGMADVLIIDSIGLLSSIYRYADVAFIGGGFGKKGLHNILEPAAFGMPVLFGPADLHKFPEGALLIEAGIAFMVRDALDFDMELTSIISNEPKRESIAEQSRRFVAHQTGATEVILRNLPANH